MRDILTLPHTRQPKRQEFIINQEIRDRQKEKTDFLQEAQKVFQERKGEVSSGIEVRNIKITISLPGESLPRDILPKQPGKGKVPVTFKTPEGLLVTADIAGKSLQKALSQIQDVPGGFVVLQGKLGKGNVILEAGLTYQKPKPVEQENPVKNEEESPSIPKGFS